MNDISYINWNLLSDSAVEKKIGYYLKRVRQEQGKTQKEVAKMADISRSTLSLLEAGESGTLKTLIKVLRVLQKLSAFNDFEYHETFSPLVLAEAQHKPIARVRKSKKYIKEEQDKNIHQGKKSDW